MEVAIRLRTIGRPRDEGRVPLLVVLDGSDYVRRASLLRLLGRLAEAGELPPHRVALVVAEERLDRSSLQ